MVRLAEAARLRLTANASIAPAASVTSASATLIPTGPATVADEEFDSLRPSAVQIAPVASYPIIGSWPAAEPAANVRRFVPFPPAERFLRALCPLYVRTSREPALVGLADRG